MMPVMVVADAAPVWVAHIRGSPAACVCVGGCVQRWRPQTSYFRVGSQASSVHHRVALQIDRSCPQLDAGDKKPGPEHQLLVSRSPGGTGERARQVSGSSIGGRYRGSESYWRDGKIARTLR